MSARERLREVAHDAYHEHNEVCACRVVGHLTAFIADRVLDASEGYGSDVLGAPAQRGPANPSTADNGPSISAEHPSADMRVTDQELHDAYAQWRAAKAQEVARWDFYERLYEQALADGWPLVRIHDVIYGRWPVGS